MHSVSKATARISSGRLKPRPFPQEPMLRFLAYWGRNKGGGSLRLLSAPNGLDFDLLFSGAGPLVGLPLVFSALAAGQIFDQSQVGLLVAPLFAVSTRNFARCSMAQGKCASRRER